VGPLSTPYNINVNDYVKVAAARALTWLVAMTTTTHLEHVRLITMGLPHRRRLQRWVIRCRSLLF